MKLNTHNRSTSAKTKKSTIIIFLLCISLSMLGQAGLKTETIENTKVYTIDNCVNEFSMDSIVQSETGYQYWFIDKHFLDGRTVKMSVIKPGSAKHPPHTHDEDEIFFILEGKAEFLLNGKSRIAKAYASLYCPANLIHGIRNAGDSDLKYLVIKNYFPK